MGTLVNILNKIENHSAEIMAQFSESADVPDMGRRQFMNLLTFGTVTGVALGALSPVVKFLFLLLLAVLVVGQQQKTSWVTTSA